jgi:hypothetical protein
MVLGAAQRTCIMATYEVTLREISTGRVADVYKTVGANEEAARREAEERILQSSTPRDLRVATIHEVPMTMVSAVGALNADPVIRSTQHELYETDLALWAKGQAELLRLRAEGTLANEADLDWSNIAQEIEDLAASEKREIRNRLAVICEHLLKWAYQPEHRSGSWRGSVVEARDGIADVLEESPSLKPYPAAVLEGAYPRGKRKAEAVAELTDLPEICPWTIEQVLDQEFWP